MKLPFISGLGCLLLYHLCLARFMSYGARPLVLLLFIAPIADIYLHMGRQVATFNRTLPRGVRLTFLGLNIRWHDVADNVYISFFTTAFVGLILASLVQGGG